MKKTHQCSHETCTIHRTGDSLIIICETCGDRSTYPLEDGEPFPPERVRVSSWVLGALLYGGACLALVGLLIVLTLAVKLIFN